MDVAELVLDYLKVLIWPAVVLTALLMFRNQLRSLFARIVEASGFGATLKLEQNAARAAEASEAIPELASAPELPQPGENEQIPPTDHVGRLLVTWNRLESVARNTAERLDLPPNAGRNLGVLSYQLRKRGLISDEVVGVARELQGIRNRVVHELDDLRLSPSFVNDFTEAANNLERVFRSVEAPASA